MGFVMQKKSYDRGAICAFWFFAIVLPTVAVLWGGDVRGAGLIEAAQTTLTWLFEAGRASSLWLAEAWGQLVK